MGKSRGPVGRTRRSAAIRRRTKAIPAASAIVAAFERPTVVARWVRQRQDDRVRIMERFQRKLKAIGLADQQIRQLTNSLLFYSVQAGEPVVAPGEAPDFVTLVGTGCVRTVAFAGPHEFTVQYAKPGYFVGLTPIARIAEGARFGAVAHVSSIVAGASHSLMRDMLRQTTPMQRLGIFAYHARALSRLIADKTALLALDVKERLICEFTRLERSFRQDDAPPGTVNLSLSHRDLSALVGSTREHVTRSIAELIRAKRLGVERQRYRLSPMEADLASHIPVTTIRRAAGVLVADRIRIPRASTSLGLPHRAVTLLMRHATLRQYTAGETIVPSDTMDLSMVVEGAARVMVDTRTGAAGVWVAKPWQFIGMGPLGVERRSNEVEELGSFWSIAVTVPTVVATFQHEVLSRVLGMLSADELLTFLGYCHASLSRQLFARCYMLCLGNADRLLYQLHLLARDFPDRAQDGCAIGIPVDLRHHLPSLIGASPGTFARLFAELRSRGYVHIDGTGRLVVCGVTPASQAE